MIVGLGVDIVELERIARTFRRFGGKFAERILAPAELEHAAKRIFDKYDEENQSFNARTISMRGKPSFASTVR